MRWNRLPVLLGSLALLLATGALAQPRPLELNEGRSLFYAVLEPAGVIGQATGTHVVESRDLSSDLCLEPGEPASLRGSLVVRTPDIQVDTQRALSAEGIDTSPGGAFASVLENEIKSERGIDVERYPTIRYEIQGVRRGQESDYVFEGPLTMHGTTRTVQIPVEVRELEGGAIAYDGRFTVDQTEYGVRPLSIPGVLTVEDDLSFRVRLVGQPGEGRCPSE